MNAAFSSITTSSKLLSRFVRYSVIEPPQQLLTVCHKSSTLAFSFMHMILLQTTPFLCPKSQNARKKSLFVLAIACGAKRDVRNSFSANFVISASAANASCSPSIYVAMPLSYTSFKVFIISAGLSSPMDASMRVILSLRVSSNCLSFSPTLSTRSVAVIWGGNLKSRRARTMGFLILNPFVKYESISLLSLPLNRIKSVDNLPGA